MVLAHVKELLVQDYNAIQMVWPQAPMAVYSAGLDSKRAYMPITVAGIQSAVKNMDAFGIQHYLMIDECFSPDTEVLTNRGFVAFPELLTTDLVAQFDKDTNEVSFVTPTKYVRREANPDDFYHLYAKNSIDMMVTGGHDFMVNKKSTGENLKNPVRDFVINGWYNQVQSGFASGTDNTLTPREKLAIMTQADGHLLCGTAKVPYLSFSFSKQRKIDEFELLMSEGNFSYTEVSPSGKSSPNAKASRRFLVRMPEDPITKQVVDHFDLASLSHAKCVSIIEYMNIWDGHVAANTEDYYLYTNGCKRSADFYQAVACLAGYTAAINAVKDDRSENFSDMYRLAINKKIRGNGTQSIKRKKVNYSGDVYCVQVPKGNIIVRRSGRVTVTGNCQLLSPDDESNYRKLIDFLKKKYPKLVVIGLSATPYRMKNGLLTDGDNALFTDIVYDITGREAFITLIRMGFLIRLKSTPTQFHYDISGIKSSGGDLNKKQLEERINTDEQTAAALDEALRRGVDCDHWLVFCSGIKHIDSVAAYLNMKNQRVTYVHSKMKKEERDQNIADFKAGKYRMIVSDNILRVGFDSCIVDHLVILCPTKSAPRHVQTLGRGVRPFYMPGFDLNTQEGRLASIAASPKLFCLVSDFAGNIDRLGPINDPLLPGSKKKKGELPVKVCPKCEEHNFVSARFCANPDCDFEFTINHAEGPNIDRTADSAEPVAEGRTPEEKKNKDMAWYRVNRVEYDKLVTGLGEMTMRVAYHCERSKKASELVTIGSETGWMHRQAVAWWKDRLPDFPPPPNVEQGCTATHLLRVPTHIYIDKNDKYPKIRRVSYDGNLELPTIHTPESILGQKADKHDRV